MKSLINKVNKNNSMSQPDIQGPVCEKCDAPLFLDKVECKDFIEGKLKQGYIICSCCGHSQILKDTKKRYKN